MPMAQILQSLKGTCRFCRQQTSLLKRDHRECRQTHQTGWQEMVQLAAQAASAYTFNEAALGQALQKKSTGAGTTIRLIPPHPSADKLQPQATILTRDSGTALGIEPETASTAVRISMGRFTTKEEVYQASQVLRSAIKTLKSEA